ncbi:beta-amyrin 28-monooxygenase [Quercus suber]|uniref:Beta-amyrin 28-monooxygenase n=1 Tax=Quercus suber TaxID=58331 RepID=A0AAW0JJC1_QUESU
MRLLANEPAVYAAVLQGIYTLDSLSQRGRDSQKRKPSGEFLKWEDLAKMKYTRRVAMETLRIHSPVFGGFRKALKDIEYGGFLIPKGWQVSEILILVTCFFSAIYLFLLLNSLSIILELRTLHNHQKFDPSRFENQASVPPYSFVAFGGGPRTCPGYEFARIETLVTIHYIITHFTWKLCADNSFSRDPMPVPTQGLPIQLVPKKPF